MTLFDKIKWVFGIAMVFLLVLATNLIDRQNFMRIVDYLTAASGQLKDNNAATNTRVTEYFGLFADTKLTPKEEIVFRRLKQEFASLQAAEASLETNREERVQLQAHLATFQEHLDGLAEIQVREGKKELYESRKALSSANLFTQLEIAALVIMALLVQVIILYTPSVES